jgi:hypothetical protein
MRATILMAGLIGLLAAPRAEIVRIWDGASYNGATDLLRFKQRWYCAFREAEARDSSGGAIRILSSGDGAHWIPAALVASRENDLRYPKLAETPDGRLMLTAAESQGRAGAGKRQTLAWFSTDGRTWGDAIEIGDPGVWLWRIAWQRGRAYSVGYATGPEHFLRLYTSRDGMSFQTLADNIYTGPSPSEASLLFLDDDTALCLLRREQGNAMLGRARPPYRGWSWKDLGMPLAGPTPVRLPDGRIAAAGRIEAGAPHTGLCWLDPDAGKLEEFLSLRSGGDTGDPGLVFHDGLLWVSYYSSHEGKADIYLARVRLQ